MRLSFIMKVFAYLFLLGTVWMFYTGRYGSVQSYTWGFYLFVTLVFLAISFLLFVGSWFVEKREKKKEKERKNENNTP